MEPNKLENQIREKLSLREIQPSAQAWDRLDTMLSIAEEKKTKRPFGFLFIAASILVFATLGMFFFSQKATEIQPKNDVVTTEIKNKSIVETPKNQVVVSTEIKKSQTKSKIVYQQSTISNQRVSIIKQNQSTSNPIINREKQIEYQINQDIAVKDMPRLVDQKTTVSTIDDAKKLDDFLLATLDNTAKKSTSKKSDVKVNSKNLLSQVDGELELTFREKVLKKVNKNYKEVKLALANRNNE